MKGTFGRIECVEHFGLDHRPSSGAPAPPMEPHREALVTDGPSQEALVTDRASQREQQPKQTDPLSEAVVTDRSSQRGSSNAHGIDARVTSSLASQCTEPGCGVRGGQPECGVGGGLGLPMIMMASEPSNGAW